MIMLATVVLFFAAFPSRAKEPAPQLFRPVGDGHGDSTFRSGSDHANAQLNQLNPALLALLHTPSAPLPLRISINLGEGRIVPLVLTNRISPGLKRSVWRGSAGEGAEGCVTLALNGDTAAGSIFLPGVGTYQIEPSAAGTHRIRRIDVNCLPVCGSKGRTRTRRDSPDESGLEPLLFAASDQAGSGSSNEAALDLLVVYTGAARSGAGGTNGMIALVDAAVAEANQAFENSLVNARLRLVMAAEVNYSESGEINDDLDRLEDDDENGPLYIVRQLRGQCRADLVCLITENTGGPFGLANQMREVELEFGEKAFSVIKREFAIAYQSLAHEIGHNLGCQHDRETSPVGGAYDFAHALRFEINNTLYHTVMGYQPGLPAPYFSNPDVLFLGIPTGIGSPATNSADNARTINLTAATAARFDSVMPRGTPPVVSLVSPTNGATFGVPSVVELVAEAHDDDGEVVEVEFYVNGVQIGRLLEPPFRLLWTNSIPGTYSLLAEARDDAGWEVNTARSRIKILPPPPTIDIPGCLAVTNGTFRVRITGYDGQDFHLETSTNLVNWSTLIDDELIGETFDYLDTHPSEGSPRFYRVLAVPDLR